MTSASIGARGGEAHKNAVTKKIKELQIDFPDAIIVQGPRIWGAASDCYCMPDIVIKKSDGTLAVYEIKTGKAGRTVRQGEIYPEIENGTARITDKAAKDLRLGENQEGKSLAEAFSSSYANGPLKIEEVRAPGYLDEPD